MQGKTLVWGIVAALIAAVIGFVGGATTRDLVAGHFDAAAGAIAAGVVGSPAPTTTASPSTPPVSSQTTATPTSAPTATPAPTVTPSPATLPPTFPPTATPLPTI